MEALSCWRSNLLQPHFEASVRMRLALPKVGTWNPPGLPQFQSSIAKVKTPRLDKFFILLERSWSVDSKMASHEPFGHLQHKLWLKEGPRVKMAVWLPTTKSQESTRPMRVQVECDTPLERSWGELQVCFRPRPNQNSEPRVISSQSTRSPIRDSFGTPKDSSLGVLGLKAIRMRVRQNNAKNTIWGKVVASPESGPWWVKWVQAVVNQMSPCCPWLVPTSRMFPKVN